MDQDKFYDLGNSEDLAASGIDLTSPPTSGETYLRQVIVGRSRCQEIVVANRDFTHYIAKQTVQIPVELLRATDTPCESSSSNFPPQSWREKQVEEFERLRTEFLERRKDIIAQSESRIRLPSVGDEVGWKRFCFERCSPQLLDVVNSYREKNKLLQAHAGTPPLSTIVASMSTPKAMDLFEFQVAWFAEEGYSVDRMHWLYALMLLIEKPLTPESCAALRDFGRELSKLRRSISANESAENRENILKACNLFLYLIIDYFGQKDLEDW